MDLKKKASEEEVALLDILWNNRLLTFPIARSALSKNRIIPKKRKNTPKPVNPIPISEGHTNHQSLTFKS